MALILASASTIRRSLLEAAGVAFEVRPSGVDESVIKNDEAPEDVALQLARIKALAGSAAAPGEWVIGSDSVVSVAGRRFDKPVSRDEAIEHLQAFSGRVIELVSAVALVGDGHVDWAHHDVARLHVRELSEDFITRYLDDEWPEVGNCVGVFRLEGRGVQLFDRIDGDHFTILGMPLLPLMGALRMRGLVPR